MEAQKKNDKLSRYMANSTKKQENKPSHYNEMEMEYDFSDSSRPEPSKKAPEKLPTQALFILPHHVSQNWPQIEKSLKALAEGKCQNIFRFLEIMNELISVHYKEESMEDADLTILLKYLERLRKEEAEDFFKNTVPFMGKLALETKQLFPDSFKILRRGVLESLFLTKRQVACLFVNMFLCTVHKQLDSKYLAARNCNFLHIFRAGSRHNEVKVQKLYCFFNYLKRMQKGSECTQAVYVSYERLGLKPSASSLLEPDFWDKSKEQLGRVTLFHKGNIEGSKGAIKVDFANAQLGGGALSEGIVQEEIFFCTHPELIPAMLFTEKFDDDESLLVIGAERFSNYSGYGTSFKFESDYQEKLETDIYQRKNNAILSIDAQNYFEMHKNAQYMQPCLLREINKAYIGLSTSEVLVETDKKLPVATGKWGCGAFGGDPQFKFFIQWIACSQAGRDMIFYTFEDDALQKLDEMVKALKGRNVGNAFKLLLDYGNALLKEKMDLDLFDYINDFF